MMCFPGVFCPARSQAPGGKDNEKREEGKGKNGGGSGKRKQRKGKSALDMQAWFNILFPKYHVSSLGKDLLQYCRVQSGGQLIITGMVR
jgi:hypothetical protein